MGIVAVAIVGVLTLVVVLAGILYAWASDLDSENSVMVEEFRVESPGIFGSNTICSDSIILLEGEIVYCGFEFTSDSNLQISVNLAEDSPKGVDVLTMTSLNFQKFQDGEEYVYFQDLSQMNTKSVSLEGGLEENSYYVVVRN